MFQSDEESVCTVEGDRKNLTNEQIPLRSWIKYFSKPDKERNKDLKKIFQKQYCFYKTMYCFLQDSQIMGKTFSKFGIPNICGELDKRFLKLNCSVSDRQKRSSRNSKYNLVLKTKNKPLNKIAQPPRYKPVAERWSDMALKRRVSEDCVEPQKIYEYTIEDKETCIMPKPVRIDMSKFQPPSQKPKVQPTNLVKQFKAQEKNSEGHVSIDDKCKNSSSSCDISKSESSEYFSTNAVINGPTFQKTTDNHKNYAKKSVTFNKELCSFAPTPECLGSSSEETSLKEKTISSKSHSTGNILSKGEMLFDQLISTSNKSSKDLFLSKDSNTSLECIKRKSKTSSIHNYKIEPYMEPCFIIEDPSSSTDDLAELIPSKSNYGKDNRVETITEQTFEKASLESISNEKINKAQHNANVTVGSNSLEGDEPIEGSSIVKSPVLIELNKENEEIIKSTPISEGEQETVVEGNSNLLLNNSKFNNLNNTIAISQQRDPSKQGKITHKLRPPVIQIETCTFNYQPESSDSSGSISDRYYISDDSQIINPKPAHEVDIESASNKMDTNCQIVDNKNYNWNTDHGVTRSTSIHVQDTLGARVNTDILSPNKYNTEFNSFKSCQNNLSPIFLQDKNKIDNMEALSERTPTVQKQSASYIENHWDSDQQNCIMANAPLKNYKCHNTSFSETQNSTVNKNICKVLFPVVTKCNDNSEENNAVNASQEPLATSSKLQKTEPSIDDTKLNSLTVPEKLQTTDDRQNNNICGQKVNIENEVNFGLEEHISSYEDESRDIEYIALTDDGEIIDKIINETNSKIEVDVINSIENIEANTKSKNDFVLHSTYQEDKCGDKLAVLSADEVSKEADPHLISDLNSKTTDGDEIVIHEMENSGNNGYVLSYEQLNDGMHNIHIETYNEEKHEKTALIDKKEEQTSLSDNEKESLVDKANPSEESFLEDIDLAISKSATVTFDVLTSQKKKLSSESKWEDRTNHCRIEMINDNEEDIFSDEYIALSDEECLVQNLQNAGVEDTVMNNMFVKGDITEKNETQPTENCSSKKEASVKTCEKLKDTMVEVDDQELTVASEKYEYLNIDTEQKKVNITTLIQKEEESYQEDSIIVFSQGKKSNEEYSVGVVIHGTETSEEHLTDEKLTIKSKSYDDHFDLIENSKLQCNSLAKVFCHSNTLPKYDKLNLLENQPKTVESQKLNLQCKFVHSGTPVKYINPVKANQHITAKCFEINNSKGVSVSRKKALHATEEFKQLTQPESVEKGTKGNLQNEVEKYSINRTKKSNTSGAITVTQKMSKSSNIITNKPPNVQIMNNTTTSSSPTELISEVNKPKTIMSIDSIGIMKPQSHASTISTFKIGCAELNSPLPSIKMCSTNSDFVSLKTRPLITNKEILTTSYQLLAKSSGGNMKPNINTLFPSYDSDNAKISKSSFISRPDSDNSRENLNTFEFSSPKTSDPFNLTDFDSNYSPDGYLSSIENNSPNKISSRARLGKRKYDLKIPDIFADLNSAPEKNVFKKKKLISNKSNISTCSFNSDEIDSDDCSLPDSLSLDSIDNEYNTNIKNTNQNEQVISVLQSSSPNKSEVTFPSLSENWYLPKSDDNSKEENDAFDPFCTQYFSDPETSSERSSEASENCNITKMWMTNN